MNESRAIADWIIWTTLHLVLGCEPQVMSSFEMDQYQYHVQLDVLWLDHHVGLGLAINNRFQEEQ